MQKTLRSLIHERIPLELRFQLELLSRKRNIVSEKKIEKIIELFREFDIKDLVLLGPGTNRYAVRIDGYVLKIATDNDGKIDNLKEFKMAKRLFPYVTKTYEVSENGTLLVAEYISPFSSYHEMLMYADKIREILTKLSSTYLIGDVGITSKNFANWGLRAGSDCPVCLDFAYVYEVSSDLFICRECNTNSMIVPDKDFKRLNCSNPSCGKEYKFEDIRAKIGNDLHRHEIGDLKEEGYYLTASNVITELTEQRSNYLASKKKSKHKNDLKSTETKTEEETTMNTNLENTMSIAKSIADEDQFSLPPIRVTAKVVDKKSDDDTTRVVAKAITHEKDEFNHDDSGDLAFSGSIDDDISIEEVIRVEAVIKPQVIQSPSVTPEVNSEVKFENHSDCNEKETLESNCVDDKVVSKATDVIDDWFIKHMHRAFSNISNRISDCLHIDTQFDRVRNDIKGKMYPEEYYKTIQNVAFRSLVAFCNFTVTTESSKNGKGTIKVFTPPVDIIGTPYEDTMVFMARVWNNRNINRVENPDMMDAYRSSYKDYLGIQREWLVLFKERLATKMNISKIAIDRTADAIATMWCVPEKEVLTDECDENLNSNESIEDEHDSMEMLSDIDEDTSGSETDDIEDIAFSGDIEIVQSPVDEEEWEDDEDEYENDAVDGYESLSVEIYHRGDYDIIRVNGEDSVGEMSIPFYTNLNSFNVDESSPSVVDDRNGVWDWLIHMTPGLIFTTNDPDKWLSFNDVELEADQPHAVILDEDNGKYTMGIYFIGGVFEVDEDDNMTLLLNEDILNKINKIIKNDIGYGRISHLRRSLGSKEFANVTYTEDQIMKMMGDENMYEPIPDTAGDTAEDAAINALIDDISEEVEDVIKVEDNVSEAVDDLINSFKNDSGQTSIKVMRRNNK